MENTLLLTLGVLHILLLWVLWICNLLYSKNRLPIIQDYLKVLLYKVDETCDTLESPAQKQQVVMILHDLLGWKRIFVPPGIVSFLITCLVWAVRKTGVPDLHKEVSSDGKGPV